MNIHKLTLHNVVKTPNICAQISVNSILACVFHRNKRNHFLLACLHPSRHMHKPLCLSVKCLNKHLNMNSPMQREKEHDKNCQTSVLVRHAYSWNKVREPWRPSVQVKEEVWPVWLTDALKVETRPQCLSLPVKEAWAWCLSVQVMKACPVFLSVSMKVGAWRKRCGFYACQSY